MPVAEGRSGFAASDRGACSQRRLCDGACRDNSDFGMGILPKSGSVEGSIGFALWGAILWNEGEVLGLQISHTNQQWLAIVQS